MPMTKKKSSNAFYSSYAANKFLNVLFSLSLLNINDNVSFDNIYSAMDSKYEPK